MKYPARTATIVLVAVILLVCSVAGVWFYHSTTAFVVGLFLSLIPCYLHENL